MEKFLHLGSVEMLPLKELLIRFLHRGSVEKFLNCGSVEMLPLKGPLRLLRHGSVEKFLHCGSVESVLYRGSIEDCADSLLGIKHHNRLLEQDRRSSYAMEVWEGFYSMEA